MSLQGLHKSVCLLCGSALLNFAEPHTCTCEVCRSQFSSDTACRQGHAICSSCDSAPEDELIERYCLHSSCTRPVEMAVTLLNLLSVPMHGPVNHFLVPAVLLTAHYNQTGDPGEKERKLKIARQQAANVVGDFCGLYGVCSMGIGTGMFISLIADMNPDAGGAWGLANQMTNESLRCIAALGAMRCCKRDTLMALKAAKRFARQNLQISLDVPDAITCEFSFYNLECLREMCPFRLPES